MSDITLAFDPDTVDLGKLAEQLYGILGGKTETLIDLLDQELEGNRGEDPFSVDDYYPEEGEYDEFLEEDEWEEETEPEEGDA
jgi:Ran GTPase-activating protein (RanGAP) involved in mRNA processing and transport